MKFSLVFMATAIVGSAAHKASLITSSDLVYSTTTITTVSDYTTACPTPTPDHESYDEFCVKACAKISERIVRCGLVPNTCWCPLFRAHKEEVDDCVECGKLLGKFVDVVHSVLAVPISFCQANIDIQPSVCSEERPVTLTSTFSSLSYTTITPTPETTPEATSEATPEATPESTPEATPESTPEATPEATSEATPEATPESTSEATSSEIPTPESTSEATPEATSSEIPTPESTSEATPESTSEATPESTSEVPTPESTSEVPAPESNSSEVPSSESTYAVETKTSTAHVNSTVATVTITSCDETKCHTIPATVVTTVTDGVTVTLTVPCETTTTEKPFYTASNATVHPTEYTKSDVSKTVITKSDTTITEIIKSGVTETATKGSESSSEVTGQSSFQTITTVTLGQTVTLTIPVTAAPETAAPNTLLPPASSAATSGSTRSSVPQSPVESSPMQANNAVQQGANIVVAIMGAAALFV